MFYVDVYMNYVDELSSMLMSYELCSMSLFYVYELCSMSLFYVFLILLHGDKLMFQSNKTDES
jgi:hypothetical protein